VTESKSPITAIGVSPLFTTKLAPPSAATKFGAIESACSKSPSDVFAPPIRVIGSKISTITIYSAKLTPCLKQNTF
jgi:hypothetical protein